MKGKSGPSVLAENALNQIASFFDYQYLWKESSNIPVFLLELVKRR